MIEFSKDHSSAWMEMMSAYQIFRAKLFDWAHEPDQKKQKDCLWITDSEQIGMPKMEFVGGHPDEYCIFLKNLTEAELAQITSLDGAPLDVKEELR